jgi:branched-subunit amino acid ABC-type transport system permease component
MNGITVTFAVAYVVGGCFFVWGASRTALVQQFLYPRRIFKLMLIFLAWPFVLPAMPAFIVAGIVWLFIPRKAVRPPQRAE